MKFLTANRLLSTKQFGLWPGSSTQDAILSVTNDWHGALESSKLVGAVFFDKGRHLTQYHMIISYLHLPKLECLASCRIGLTTISRTRSNVSSSIEHRHLCQPFTRKIYSSVILPKLDYCCSVWDPHLKKDKQALDKVHKVQKFAGRVVSHEWKLDLPTLQYHLKWKEPTTRRKAIKLKVCCKIAKNQSPIPSSSFTPHPRPSPVIPYLNPLCNRIHTLFHFLLM